MPKGFSQVYMNFLRGPISCLATTQRRSAMQRGDEEYIASSVQNKHNGQTLMDSRTNHQGDKDDSCFGSCADGE